MQKIVFFWLKTYFFFFFTIICGVGLLKSLSLGLPKKDFVYASCLKDNFVEYRILGCRVFFSFNKDFYEFSSCLPGFWWEVALICIFIPLQVRFYSPSGLLRDFHFVFAFLSLISMSRYEFFVLSPSLSSLSFLDV